LAGSFIFTKAAEEDFGFKTGFRQFDDFSISESIVAATTEPRVP
jgi:hypothetical protein